MPSAGSQQGGREAEGGREGEDRRRGEDGGVRSQGCGGKREPTLGRLSQGESPEGFTQHMP